MQMNKRVVTMDNILMVYCSTLGEGVVGRKLMKKCDRGRAEAMNHNN